MWQTRWTIPAAAAQTKRPSSIAQSLCFSRGFWGGEGAGSRVAGRGERCFPTRKYTSACESFRVSCLKPSFSFYSAPAHRWLFLVSGGAISSSTSTALPYAKVSQMSINHNFAFTPSTPAPPPSAMISKRGQSRSKNTWHLERRLRRLPRRPHREIQELSPRHGHLLHQRPARAAGRPPPAKGVPGGAAAFARRPRRPEPLKAPRRAAQPLQPARVLLLVEQPRK